jgi:hypothetical protein
MISKINKQNRKNAALTMIEMLVGLTILMVVLTSFYMVISYYSNSFLRIDDSVIRSSDGWKVVHSLQEDIISVDLPDNDIGKWRDAIQTNEDGCVLTRRIAGDLKQIFYIWDKSKFSLTRKVDGKAKTLIYNTCKEFSIEPEYVLSESSDVPDLVRVCLYLVLDEENKKGKNKKDTSLVIKNYFTPELLNRKIKQTYFHDGIPELAD